MVLRLRFIGLLLVNAIVAIVGTAIAESAVYKVLPSSHSVAAVLIKETVLSFFLAALIGLGMWRTWRSEPAKWTWVLTSIWFAIGAILLAGRGGVFGSLVPSASPSPNELRSFFTFTLVCLRGLAFSGGAYISSLIFTSLPVRSAE